MQCTGCSSGGKGHPWTTKLELFGRNIHETSIFYSAGSTTAPAIAQPSPAGKQIMHQRGEEGGGLEEGSGQDRPLYFRQNYKRLQYIYLFQQIYYMKTRRLMYRWPVCEWYGSDLLTWPPPALSRPCSWGWRGVVSSLRRGSGENGEEVWRLSTGE